ncbi:MAG: hypothetical protein ACM3XN_03690 [Chloroflexota bacterium]
MLILAEKDKVKRIVDAIAAAERLLEPGTGMIFSFPVSHVIGLHLRDDWTDA